MATRRHQPRFSILALTLHRSVGRYFGNGNDRIVGPIDELDANRSFQIGLAERIKNAHITSYLQTQFLELLQSLGIAFRIIHGIVCVRGGSIFLPPCCFGRILDHPGVKITDSAA